MRATSRPRRLQWIAAASACVAAMAMGPRVGRAAEVAPAEILVVDAENGWPVPLVQLRTTHDLLLVSDNSGVIAVDHPELLGRAAWFEIEGHGYGVAADGLGYRGRRLTLHPGQRQVVELHRELPAKRLGRLTGAGIFAESQRLGRQRDWQESGVFGCDSVQRAVYRDRLFWLWGDTDLAGYPLGIFDAAGATSPLEVRDDWQPPLRLGGEFQYFRNAEGAPRAIADIPGDGPTWLWGLIALPNEHGRERLCASYEKVRDGLKPYELGLCIWDDQSETFRRERVVWTRTADDQQAPSLPTGHPVRWQDEAGDQWALFGDPFPHLRCRATVAAWRDPAAWERLTPQRELQAAGEDRSIRISRGAIAYSEFRKRWVAVFLQFGGEPSALGELWYCEADAPTGPWGPAVKVVTHANYSFYNPALHPELTPTGSPVLLLEATYTSAFADHAPKTPRYDYNQVMYRLDLDDPALAAAQGGGE